MVEEWSRVKEKQHGPAAALCKGGGDVGGGGTEVDRLAMIVQ